MPLNVVAYEKGKGDKRTITIVVNGKPVTFSGRAGSGPWRYIATKRFPTGLLAMDIATAADALEREKKFFVLEWKTDEKADSGL